MKKVASLIIIIMILLASGCSNGAKSTVETIDISDSNLFYQNKTENFGADPFILVDEEDGQKIFYLYSTSRELGAKGFEILFSNDLSNWHNGGPIFMCDGTWCSKSLWAPEVIEDNGIYYLFYSAQNKTDNEGFYISVATSKSPAGPFNEYVSESKAISEPLFSFEKHNNQIPAELRSNLTGIDGKVGYIKVIDASPFVDPVSGKKYLYFIADLNTEYTYESFVLGMEMEDWTTPKYETLTRITEFGKAVPGGDEIVLEGGRTNEGCTVTYHDGIYYLTFSTFTYMTAEYQVRQALADSPLGPFRKIQNNDGGTVIFTEASTIRQSAGHSSIFELDGELYMVYHTFFNDATIDAGRKPAVDKIAFVKNYEGLTVMQTNGPTTTPQPLPAAISSYRNVALEAKVNCDNGAGKLDASLVNDGFIPLHRQSPVSEYIINPGQTTITFDFDKETEIAAVLVYTSIKDAMRLRSVESIVFENGEESETVINVELDDEKYMQYKKIAYDQACSAVLKEPLKAKKITITINEDYTVGIPEIIILGR